MDKRSNDYLMQAPKKDNKKGQAGHVPKVCILSGDRRIIPSVRNEPGVWQMAGASERQKGRHVRALWPEDRPAEIRNHENAELARPLRRAPMPSRRVVRRLVFE